ncbi:MAG: DsbA family protein [Anaerolineae bacterium]|nr:DsbA family protein [Anaerolineae bacterium]
MSKKTLKTANRSKKSPRRVNWWILGALSIMLVAAITINVIQQNQNKVDPVAIAPNEISQDKSIGSADAPVVVVEYGDYQCPACGDFALTVKPKIMEEFVNTGQVRFVFRSFQFVGEESQWAAEASECANEQGKFWEYYDKLYSSQAGENAGAFKKENLEGFAAELGLQTEQFNQCLASGKYTEKVKSETLEAQNLGLRGTPSLFVNGIFVEDGSHYEVLSQKIREGFEK